MNPLLEQSEAGVGEGGKRPDCSPQSLDDLLTQEGTQDEPSVIPLQLKCAKPHFSEKEKEYFAAAALEGKIGQTYFTHPDVQMCYRCPLCDKVLNPDSIARRAARHFLTQRNIPNRKYVATLHDAENKKVVITHISSRQPI